MFLLLLIVLELEIIIQLLSPHHYTVTVKELKMADIPAGGAPGVFQAALNDNGTPIGLPAGATWNWTSNVPEAILTPTVDHVSVSIPATSTATSITVTASTVDPNGKPVSGAITVPVVPGVVHNFTVTVTQIS
jgi:hypothetical protein